MPWRELPSGEAMSLAASAPVGRLVVAVGEIVDVYPVTHTVLDGHILFRTSPGSKLAGLAASAGVLFETDAVGEDESWSVVVRGVARRLERDDELDAVRDALRPPFVRDRKDVVVRITPLAVSGRLFVPSDEDGTEDLTLDAPD
jgi:nitroimidazol reductase NimA-like FMN-containing flavoprotein (pyridoxamine 5'-phosphate oxidase superfamily)